MTSQAKKSIPCVIPFYRLVLRKKEGEDVHGSPIAGTTFYEKWFGFSRGEKGNQSTLALLLLWPWSASILSRRKVWAF